jgi:hypothetical protein
LDRKLKVISAETQIHITSTSNAMNSLSSAAAMAAALLLLLFLSMEAHAFSILLVGSTTSTRSQTYLAMSSLSLPRKISPDAFNDDNKRHTIHHIQDEQQHR